MGVDPRNICCPQPLSPGFSKDESKGYEHEELGPAAGCTDVSGIGRLLDADRRDLANTPDGFYEFTDIAGKRVRVKAADVATVRKEK
jgi:hypothetical protein